jgi:predicted ATPase/class 3 adenylate cyclase
VDTILCPGCGEENPSKFRLCGYCGTALVVAPAVVVCATCGEENPSKFRLCGFCGASLGVSGGEAVATAPVAPAPRRQVPAARIPALPAQEVRKFVTLVFSDIKDSTALTASIDGEAMNEIKARYFTTMAAEIERHGGKVEKYVGDAIMAVFGLVRAHEDDALRAIRAAAGMKDALGRLNDELFDFYGVRLTNRTGVNTGEIVANTDPHASQNLATGDAVNVAARLEQNAPAGEVLVGEMTYELVRGHVEVERLELALKGKAELVPAYRLVALRSATGPSVSTASPFVGRVAERGRLADAYAAATGDRRARLLTVVGDAGVGKTRLIADFMGAIALEATVLRGRCLAYGDGITFWPLVEVVREAARIGEDDSAETARDRIGSLLPAGLAERDEILERVASAVGLSTDPYPVAELFWGARKLLEALAADRPLVVVIDDIHSAEVTFLELLDYLVRSVEESALLILCSARPELLDEHPEWVESAGTDRIHLQPLGASDVEAMIDRLLGEADLSSATRRRVVEAAEGNPLFIEQMVSMLRERGSTGDVVVPATIHALLAARLDDLTQEERAIVDPASVIGLVFPAQAVEDLVPSLLRAGVAERLADLDRKQFVHPLTADGEDPAFRFHHILVRDAAYQSLLKRARATLHEKFVDWAEPVNRERGRETEFEEILGYHLEQAVRYRSELGPLDEGGRRLAMRAATKLASAGRRAFARGDTPAACSLLRRATLLPPADDPFRLGLLVELADALLEEGAFEEAAFVLSEATERAERIGDARLVASSRIGRRTLDLQASGLTGTEAVMADVMSLTPVFEAAGDEGGLARAWRLLMVIHGTVGAYDEAAAAAKRVVDHARAAGDSRLAARGAIGYAVTALHGPTPATEALRRTERLIEDVQGDRKAEAVILGVLAQLHAMRGSFEVAREMYLRARSMLEDLGPSVTAASTSTESSRVEVLAGDLDAAERELRRDHDTLAGMGERYYRSTVAGLLAGVLEAAGRLEEAEELSRSAEELADEDDVFSQVAWRAARARAFARAGRGDEAEALARAALRLAEQTVDIALQADAWDDLGTVLERLGRADEAESARRAALELYERKEDAVSAARIRATLADVVRT